MRDIKSILINRNCNGTVTRKIPQPGCGIFFAYFMCTDTRETCKKLLRFVLVMDRIVLMIWNRIVLYSL